MTKKKSNGTLGADLSDRQKKQQTAILAISIPVCFLILCLSTTNLIKGVTLALMLLTLGSVILVFGKLRERIGLPILVLGALVLMEGLSTLYADVGKFALREYLYALAAFCAMMLLLCFAPSRGIKPERWIGTVLTGTCGLVSLVSIDMLSTHLISGPVLWLLELFVPGFSAYTGVQAGVRMTALFSNANVYAGIAGLGVLLGLGLACSAESGRERTVQTVILYINALGFLLAFSMGATATIALAFLVLLALERQERRISLTALMLQTFVLGVLAAAVISLTSFKAWSGFQPVPMLCVILGAAGLCLSDKYAGQPLAQKLAGRGKLIPLIIAAVLAALVIFGLAAYNLTGGVSLGAGEALRRAAYPEPGEYTLTTAADGGLTVTIESQDRQETMMHTSTVLYSGEANGAVFTVPEDSLVVYFNFAAPAAVRVDAVTFDGAAGSGSVPLGYKLLPGFMANRLQGLWANENAIQRFVFFSDGMKMFRKSPIIGLGIGSYEAYLRSVQSFPYDTKYAHDHYIQVLVETGLVGFVLFAGLLVCSAACVWRARKKNAHPLVPALGAALAFMAGHAAVEVVFSFSAYLPFAFGCFALISLCCADALPKLRPGRKLRTASLAVLSGWTGIYILLLLGNMRAAAIFSKPSITFDDVEQAITIDRFEWSDYALSYLNSAADVENVPEIRGKADKYAQRMSTKMSNSTHYYLAEYYFRTDQPEAAIAELERHVEAAAADANAWNKAIDLLEAYAQDEPLYRDAARHLAQMLEQWNKENMATISLDESASAFIARMCGE